MQQEQEVDMTKQIYIRNNKSQILQGALETSRQKIEIYSPKPKKYHTNRQRLQADVCSA